MSEGNNTQQPDSQQQRPEYRDERRPHAHRRDDYYCPPRDSRPHHGGAFGGGVYFLGFVGALVYFIQHATTFSIGFMGFLKALVWPALLVYKLVEFLKI